MTSKRTSCQDCWVAWDLSTRWYSWGITDTALTIYDTAMREHEQRGLTGAVDGVLRQLPPSVVKPIVMATEATSNVLGGMRNQIHPDARQEESQKWRQGEE